MNLARSLHASARVAPARAELAGALLLVLTLPGWWLNPPMFLACWLTAWWCLLGLVLGGLANLWMHVLTGGAWGTLLRPAGLAAARRLPLALLLGLPVAALLPRLYLWAEDMPAFTQGMAQPAFAAWWMQPGFVLVRLAAFGAVWWWLSRCAAGLHKGRAAAALALYLLTGTLVSVDLLMSLVPRWYSTAFGLVVLTGQMLGGSALLVLFAALATPAALAAPRKHAPPPARDLANLMLTWLMGWGYVAFMEFLIIWSEDLPAETAWYLPRLRSGWSAFETGAMAAGVLMGAALLQRRLKDHPPRLALLAAALLLLQLANSAWLVLPSVDADSALGWWLVPQMALGMGLLLFGGVPRVLRGPAQGAGHGA
jgi:hypothetical protein